MLDNLTRVIEYCQRIHDGIPVPEPHIVADENQGTTLLNNPAIAGPQLVISMPLAVFSGNCNAMTGPLTFLIYALDKAKELTTKPANVVGQYLETVEMLNLILEKIAEDIGGDTFCSLLSGMELLEVEARPAAGVFGGWNGYSAAITLK